MNSVAQRSYDNQSPPDDNDGERFDEWLTDIAIEQPATFNEWVGEWMDWATELRGTCRRIFGQVGVKRFDAIVSVNLTDSLHAYIRDRHWPAARAELDAKFGRDDS